MREITLLEVDERNERVPHVFHFPASWEEVDHDGLMRIAQCHLQCKTDTSARFNLLRDLAGIPARLMAMMPDAEEMMYPPQVDPANVNAEPAQPTLLPELDWAFTPPVWMESRMPVLQHDGSTWIGPADHLQNACVGQWVYAVSTLNDMQASEDEKEADRLLDLFLSCIYVPDGTSWNKHLDANAPRLATLPPHVKVAAVMNFQALHAVLPLCFPRVFKQKEQAQSPVGLHALTFSVAKSGVFGPYQKVENESLLTVLSYMEHQLFEDEEDQRRADKAAGKIRV